MIICAAGHRSRNGLDNTSGVTEERGRNSRGDCLASSRLPAPWCVCSDAPRELWFTTVVSRKKVSSKQSKSSFQIHKYDDATLCIRRNFASYIFA